MTDTSKRKRDDDLSGRSAKKKKGYNQWRNKASVPGHANAESHAGRATIESGDAGVFVTFAKGRDAKCMSEAKDVFRQYAEKLYGDVLPGEEARKTGRLDREPGSVDDGDDIDIESEIQKEIDELKPGFLPQTQSLFSSVRLDIPCVAFIKVADPIDPVRLVHEVCVDAQRDPEQKSSRWIQRMTPVTAVRKVLDSGLEDLAAKVLKPCFHSGGPPKKFAIRPTIRNHTIWTRDATIRKVAEMVGPPHTVDLKNYDLLILVDIFRNVCGMSVVGSDYDQLKRFNLAEIYSPTPKEKEQHESPATRTQDAVLREPKRLGVSSD